MQHVIGIDPSLSGTGFIALDSRGEVVQRDRLTSEASGHEVLSRMNRYEMLVQEIKAKCRKWSPELVCIEGYSFMSNFGSALDRIEYGGLLRYVLTREWPVLEVSPMSLKKWASGSGKGDKTGVIVGITSLYGVRFGTSDEYDAYALARIALQIKKFEISANVPQKEVIAVLNGEKPKPKPRKKKEPS